MSEQDVPADTAPAGEPAGAKDRFREALERKRAKQHPHEGATRNSSKVHAERGAAGGKRAFRRKSG